MRNSSQLTVKLLARDGTWETCGSDRLRGVVPENFQATADRWGSATCSFVLRRSQGAAYPDLTAHTPIDVEVGGELVWSGRIKETPAADNAVTVQGEGWQYHLDDDVYHPFLAHARLDDFINTAQLATADLATRHKAWGQVEIDGSAGITLKVPAGTVVATDTAVGVTVALRPFERSGGGLNAGAIRAVIQIDSSNNNSSFVYDVFGHDFEYWDDAGSARADFIVNQSTMVASETRAGTVASRKRFVTILLLCNSGTTPAADVWLRVKRLLLVDSTAYESGNLSILKSNQVATDALLKATTQLSSDLTQISVGTFSVGDFAPSELQTPREIISAVNAYENYETRVDVYKRLVFRPRASEPIYEIGEWSGAAFEDASSNSSEDVYNRVRATASGPAGERIGYEAFTKGPWITSPSGTVPNSGFEVNANNWTFEQSGSSGGTITRDLAQFNTGVASGLITTSVAGLALVWTTISGLVPGQAYQLSISMRRKATTGVQTLIQLHYYDGTGAFNGASFRAVAFPGTSGVDADFPLNTWIRVPLTFVAEWPSHHFSISTGSTVVSTGVFNIDDLAIETSGATFIDRRFSQRTKILPLSHAATSGTIRRIADLYLDQHTTTPFRGSFRAVGQGGVRRHIGGGGVHPATLLRETGQLVRCSHRIDPDNGRWGRDGTIAAVSYDHSSQTSQVTLDDERGGFEALLQRLAVVVGQ